MMVSLCVNLMKAMAVSIIGVPERVFCRCDESLREIILDALGGFQLML